MIIEPPPIRLAIMNDMSAASIHHFVRWQVWKDCLIMRSLRMPLTIG